MATLDLYSLDFPHGSPQGYYDGCKTNPPCENFGSTEWLTCKEAFANRSTDFSASKLPLDQKIPRPQAEMPTTSPKPKPSKPLTVEPVVDVYEELLTEAGTAISDALDSHLAESPTFQQPLVDPHPTMTDKEKRGHYSKGCRLQPCKDAVTKAAREKREEKKRLAELEAEGVDTTETPVEAPPADETYSIEHEMVTVPVAAAKRPYSLAGALRGQIDAIDLLVKKEAGVDVDALAELYDVPPELLTTTEHALAYPPQVAATIDSAQVEGVSISWHHAIEQRDRARDDVFTLRQQLAARESDIARHNHDYQQLYLAHEKLRNDTAIDEALTQLGRDLANDGLQGRLTAAEDLARERLAEILQLRSALAGQTTVAAGSVTVMITIGSN